MTTVAILGTGLIGGSVGLALAGVPGVVVDAGYDADPEVAAEAVRLGAVRRVAGTVGDAVAGADVVFVAVPVSSIAAVALDAARHLGPGRVVTDVGSVKGPVVATVEAGLPPGVSFLGGHPMAGSELDGIGAAGADLFRNAVWALTPTAVTAPDAVETVHRLVAATGAAPLLLDPAAHDLAVAVVSHVPQVAAAALMAVAARHAEEAPPVFRLAAGGFRDVTRIAAGSPSVWEDILAENAPAVRSVLDDYVAALTDLRDRLGDRPRLHEVLAAATEARRTLPAAVDAGELYSVVVPITDRPGVFASVTTALGEAGVNIADIELRHSPEGGGGLLTLGILGAGQAATAAGTLRELGYRAHVEGVAE